MERRLINIDGLRAIAALAVVFQHFSGDLWREYSESSRYLKPFALDCFDWGRFGVVLFFLISGYVIPFSFSGATPKRKFVASRIFRLYPAYWLSIAATIGALAMAGISLPTRQVLANMTMFYPGFGEPALNGVYWTLIIELLFYAVCFALFVLGHIENPKTVAALAFAGIASVVIPLMLGKSTLPLHGYFLSFLLLGCLIRQSREGLRYAKPLAVATAVAILAAIPVVSLANAGKPSAFSFSTLQGVSLAIVCAGALFILSWSSTFVSIAGRLKPIGDWSYSIYLLHVPIAMTLIFILHPHDTITALEFFIACVTLSIAAAAMTYRLLERPCIALGKRFFMRPSSDDSHRRLHPRAS